jgi:hypothetical protein
MQLSIGEWGFYRGPSNVIQNRNVPKDFLG